MTRETPTTPEPLALTVREVLRIVPLGRTAVYDAIKRGDIPSVRVGGRVLIPRAALARMFGAGPIEEPRSAA